MEQKKQFDRRRRAKPKDIKVGDLILIKQQKSTTKPPFDPAPYTVDHISGNRVTASRNGEVKVRDKNHIKKVKNRPEYVRPSWEQKRQTLPTLYEEQDIDCFWRRDKADHASRDSAYEDIALREHEENVATGESASENYASDEHGEVVVPANSTGEDHASEEHDDNTQGQYPSEASAVAASEDSQVADDDMEAHLQSLLHAAEKRVTRSSGKNLQWNSTIGDTCVVLEQ